MDIFKVTLNVPYRFQPKEGERPLDEIVAEMIAKMTEMGGRKYSSNSNHEYLLPGHRIGKLFATFPIGRYSGNDNIAFIEECEQVFDGEAIDNRMESMLTRMEGLLAKTSSMAESFTHSAGGSVAGWNSHTGSPIPGLQLASINDLMLCEDYCTDALQEKLNDGWRLIAVCPQEARRPDYILGRYFDPTTVMRDHQHAQRG